MADYPYPFTSDPKAKFDTGRKSGTSLQGAPLSKLSGQLDNILKKFPDMSKFGREIMFNEYIDQFTKINTKQSDLFETLLDSQQTIVEGILETSSRSQAKTNKQMLSYFEKEISTLAGNQEITSEEKDFFSEMIKELKKTNKNLLETDFSIKNVLKEKVKERLPSLTGIMGAIGLDNPAFLFLGEMIQDVVSASRAKKKDQEELLSKVKERQLKAQLEDAGLISNDTMEEFGDDQAEFYDEFKDEATDVLNDTMKLMTDQNEMTTDNLEALSDRYTDLISRMSAFLTGTESVMKAGFDESNLWLESIEDSMNVLTKDTQGSKFAAIEKAREDQIRHDEMIDTLENLQTEPITAEETKKSGEGVLSSLGNLGEVFQTLLMTIPFIGKFFRKFITFAKVFGKFSGILTIAFAAVDFVIGAFDGWNNAAEKLGKNLEDITVFDKIAAAFATGIGKVFGFVDSFFGLFGIKTEIGPYVEKKLLDLYKFFTEDIGKFFKDFWNSLMDKIKGVPASLKKETDNWGKGGPTDTGVSVSELDASKPTSKTSAGKVDSSETSWGDYDTNKPTKKQDTPLPVPLNGSIPASKYDEMIERIAKEEGVDPNLVKRMIKQESSFNPNAVSPVGAKGLMQLMPGTAKEMGVENPFDPEQNIRGGTKYIAKMLKSQGGDVQRALATYNWGLGNLQNKGLENAPKETRDYVRKIAGDDLAITSEPKNLLAEQKTATLQQSKEQETKNGAGGIAANSVVNSPKTTVNNSTSKTFPFSNTTAEELDPSLKYAYAMRSY